MKKLGKAVVVAASMALLVSAVSASTVLGHAGRGGAGWIHACIVTKDGTFVKAVQNPDAKCPNGSTPVHWRVNLKADPNGLPGPQGPAGPAGPAGPPGPPGTNGADGADGEAGPPGTNGTNGANGANGADGADGADGVSGLQLVTGAVSNDNENSKSVTATCPDDKVVVGGGFRTSNVSDASEVVILSSYPSSSTVWTATGDLDSTGQGDQSYSLQAYALCAFAS